MSVDDDGLYVLADALGGIFRQRGWRLVTAESCTGGWIAECVTDIAGSSGWFERGYVTYSNAAKTEMLGVEPGLIETHGAVSPAVVRAMAAGALKHSQAQVAVAVSGIAGPSGGTPKKPVGTVWFAWQQRGEEAAARCKLLAGERRAVRRQAVEVALRGLLELGRE
ncbi:MAG: CinA family protein [Methylococcaceae bacterium]|nr:CinA family protein [Methylococcaceae bacterium]